MTTMIDQNLYRTIVVISFNIWVMWSPDGEIGDLYYAKYKFSVFFFFICKCKDLLYLDFYTPFSF